MAPPFLQIRCQHEIQGQNVGKYHAGATVLAPRFEFHGAGPERCRGHIKTVRTVGWVDLPRERWRPRCEWWLKVTCSDPSKVEGRMDHDWSLWPSSWGHSVWSWNHETMRNHGHRCKLNDWLQNRPWGVWLSRNSCVSAVSISTTSATIEVTSQGFGLGVGLPSEGRTAGDRGFSNWSEMGNRVNSG
jgi:hypothetical protein